MSRITPAKPYLPVLVISLPHSSRRGIIAGRLADLGVDFTFIDAVPGSSLSDRDIAEFTDPARTKRRMGRLLTRNEIGCALSHRKAYHEIITSGSDAAIILEDDAIPEPECLDLLRTWQDMPDQIDLLSLFKCSGIIARRGGYQLEHIRLARAASTIESTCGYFIRRATAQKLFDMTKKISSVSDWPFDLRDVRHFVTQPDLVRHDFSLPSEVGEDRPGFKAPPPSLARKIQGLKAFLFISYIKNREQYDSFYNYYERELRVRLMARLPWLYEILPGYYRWSDDGG